MTLEFYTNIMRSPENRGVTLDIRNTSFNPKDAIAWIENQDTPSQLVLVFILPCLALHI